MDISNDSQQEIDPIQYLTKKFPADLKQYIAVRDELAVRQGALSAAQDTVALKEAATKELTNAQAEAAELKAEAKDNLAKAKTAKAVQDTRTKTLDAAEVALNDKIAEFKKSVALREAAVSNREASASELEDKLKKQTSDLADSQAAHDARVKAFQDKVAALSA
jgi:chromosome segregation ATPase